MSASAALKNLLASRSGTSAEDWFLVFKARYGMEAVFSAVRATVGPGNVATQIFTCATAVNPILAAGLTPRYSEIDPDTFALAPTAFGVRADDRAAVIQNTFGVIDDESARVLGEVARTNGLVVVEDSAHAVGRFARGVDGRPVADVSVHSFGVEKLLPTKFGGAIWLNPHTRDEGYTTEVRAAMVSALTALPAPSGKQAFAAKSYRNQLRILTRVPGGLGRRLRTMLVNAGLFDPPISEQESRGRQRQPVGISPWVAQQAVAALESVADIESQRESAVQVYVRELEGVVTIPAAVSRGGAFVRFPFYVSSAQQAEDMITDLSRAGVPAGRWYRPALFPGAHDPQVYNYAPGSSELRVSEDAIARVVNLPTNVSEQRALEIVQLVRRFLAS